MLLNDQGLPVQAGDAVKVIPPRYKAHTQAAGVEKIYLSYRRLNIRKQVEGLSSKLRDPRYDFLFKPGPWCPDLEGIPEKDLN